MHFAPSLNAQPHHFPFHSFPTFLSFLSSQTSAFPTSTLLFASLSLMNPSEEFVEGGSSREKPKRLSSRAVLTLAYQSLGVVYGDLSTSPLYVYKTTFSGKLSLHETDQEVYGVLSFIFWTFTIIALLKYIFIVMSADDNGEGGTFALYSLLCRHARLSVLPNQEPVDEKLCAYEAERDADTWQSSLLRSTFEKRPKLRQGLFIFVLLGTSMAIGDGVFTPAISVLSSVSGLRVKVTELHENYVIAISCIILVGLFSLQHQGTHKVAFLFAPIVTAWLLCISGIGLYNVLKWNPSIFHALSPFHMFKFLQSTGLEGWVSLGGIVLSITGVEAMFADLGHFSALPIKMAFTFVIYPSMILAYMGEAAFLSRHHEDIRRSFYKSIPEAVFWPVFIVATFASVVGSQAVISATFSIVSQCCALHSFPHVKTVHTSSKIYGQIYIPEVNWTLMLLCLAVTIGLRDPNMIGHAYGLAVSTVMFVTTCLMSLVMIIVWKRSIGNGIAFFLFFGSIELLYFTACALKVPEGGWIPLVMSLITTSLMYVWNYGTLKKHTFDVENKVSIDSIVSLGPGLGIVRVPGIGLVYSNLTSGVPAMFGHFVTNLPAFHQVLVFVCVKSVQVPHVCEEERLLILRVGPKEYCMFRCIVRYGYKDVKCESYNFECQLVSAIVQHIETEEDDLKSTDELSEGCKSLSFDYVEVADRVFSNPSHRENDRVSSWDHGEMKIASCQGEKEKTLLKNESVEILKAKECGMACIVDHISVKAKKPSSVLKKFVVDVVFAFLSENCRGADVVLNLPHTSLLEVGMIYHV